jgi:hypothetical protein
VLQEPGARHEKNGVRQFVQHEVNCREFGRHALLRKTKSQRRAEMACEALGPSKIDRLEIAARRVAKGDKDRGGRVLEQRRRRHDAMKALRREPVGVKLGPNEIRFGRDHLVGERLLPRGDLPPDPVAGREALVCRIEAQVDADLAEATKLMGFHVLNAEPCPNGPEPLGNFFEREPPRGVILHAVVDQIDEPLVVRHRNSASPGLARCGKESTIVLQLNLLFPRLPSASACYSPIGWRSKQ